MTKLVSRLFGFCLVIVLFSSVVPKAHANYVHRTDDGVCYVPTWYLGDIDDPNDNGWLNVVVPCIYTQYNVSQDEIRYSECVVHWGYGEATITISCTDIIDAWKLN